MKIFAQRNKKKSNRSLRPDITPNSNANTTVAQTASNFVTQTNSGTAAAAAGAAAKTVSSGQPPSTRESEDDAPSSAGSYEHAKSSGSTLKSSQMVDEQMNFSQRTSTPNAVSSDREQATGSISHTLNGTTDLQEQAERNAITRELVKKFVADIWNRGDLELIPQVCSKNLRFNGSVGMDRVGHDGFARMVTTIREALNDYHCEIHSMVVEGNKAFCRMRFTGRHTGPLLGFAPSGKQVAWMGAAEFTCKNGLIIKVWELGDVKSLEEQLGE